MVKIKPVREESRIIENTPTQQGESPPNNKNITGSQESCADSPYSDLLKHELPPNIRSAAHFWFEFGFTPIPLVPGKKVTALRWAIWSAGLSHDSIDQHWDEHPDHELGIIVDERIFVIDADSQEAIDSLYRLEKAISVAPNLIVKTDKGEHHYFQRASGTFARMDSHSTAQHPARLDVRTGRGNGEGRSMVVVPPTPGRSIIINEAACAEDLVEIDQDFIDAIAVHNGRQPPRAVAPRAVQTAPADASMAIVQKLLAHIPSNCGYQDWLQVLMGVFHYTGGSDEGLAVVDAWSSTAKNYCGSEELEYKWRSFGGYSGTPITLRTVCRMAGVNGADVTDILASDEPDFERVTDEIIDTRMVELEVDVNELMRYALNGMSPEFEANMLADIFILGAIALLGQSTVIFAKYNTGKTLLLLWLLIEAIRRGIINPRNVFYFDADDSHAGLTEKMKLAEEYEFNIIAPGYKGFDARTFLATIKLISDKDKARGVVMILDTLKKFCSVFNKDTAAAFGTVIREFVLKGGTVISLAHVNKKLGPDGKPVPEGTSDIPSDADCIYILDTVSVEGNTKTVQFTNEKSRGRVAPRAAYSYSIEQGLSYIELLASVQPVEDREAVALTRSAFSVDGVPANASDVDAEYISVITACIRAGETKKIDLTKALCKHTGISRRSAIRVIEQYTGTNPAIHHWCYSVEAHGTHSFRLLIEPADITSDPADIEPSEVTDF